MIHFYTFSMHNQIPEMIRIFEEKGLAIGYYRRCGNVATGVGRLVFDLISS